MNQMAPEAAAGGESEGGPMWGKFFESIGHEDTESMLSGSGVPTDLRHSRNLSRSVSAMIQSPHSEVHPNDSASAVGEDDGSVLDAYRRGHNAPSISGVNPPPVDDGTYVFKFRTPSGRTHRFQARHDQVETLREIVAGKLATDPFFTSFKVASEDDLPPDPADFLLSYTDEDGDIVLITSDSDVSDAVKNARTASQDRVVLFVQGGKGWETATAEKSARQAAEVAAAAKEEVKEIENVEGAATPTAATPAAPIPLPEHHYAPPAPVHVHEEDKVLGLPRDLLLPASIGALAAVILGIFTVSRLSR